MAAVLAPITEPIAEFFDMFYIGEGETVYDQLLDIYKENKKNGGSRWDYLAKAAEVEGIYVPAFYDVTYKEDGTIDSFVPNHPNAKEKIKKQLVMDMSEAVYPENPVVPFIRATRTVLYLKSSVAVTEAAASVRQECCTVRPEKKT